MIAALNKDRNKIPTYSEERTVEVMEKSGVWVSGAKLYGTDIPKVTWDDVRTAPSFKQKDKNQSFKSPAHLISSIVQLAIKLNSNNVSIPEWFDDTIKYLDENVAIRTLVQKKLQDYHETALSYADLHKYIGG